MNEAEQTLTLMYLVGIFCIAVGSLIFYLIPLIWVLRSGRSHGGTKFGWFLVVCFFSWIGLAVFLILTPSVSQKLPKKEKPMNEQPVEKKGFSWLGFFFAPAYYAGYGKLLKGIVLGIISVIPLIGIGAYIYGGIKAKKELPVGVNKFKWGPAIVITLLISTTYFTLFSIKEFVLEKSLEDSFVNDYSGVWKADNGVQIILDVAKPQKTMSMSMNGTVFLKDIKLTVKNQDQSTGTIVFEVDAPEGTQEWAFKKTDETDYSYNLYMKNSTGRESHLIYEREVNAQKPDGNNESEETSNISGKPRILKTVLHESDAKFLGYAEMDWGCMSYFIINGEKVEVEGCPKDKSIYENKEGKILKLKYETGMVEGFETFYFVDVSPSNG